MTRYGNSRWITCPRCGRGKPERSLCGCLGIPRPGSPAPREPAPIAPAQALVYGCVLVALVLATAALEGVVMVGNALEAWRDG